MTETHSEMRPGTWQVPECPLLIEYQPSVMDEIRLAAVDAFFSLPRGGAEIGGVLYGRRAGSAVCIQAFRPIECEHAMGPTFVLSDKDKTRLQEQLDASAQDPLLAGLEIVGWYHTHTRSEIFLSDLDLEIYSRFFPESWHVALVVRPMGMKPTRAGFFFRERDRSVRSSASYHEFIVAPSGEARAGSTGRPEPAPAVARAAPGPSRRLLEAALEPQVEPPDTENGAAVPPTAPVVLQRIAAPPADSPPVEAVQPMEVRPAEFVPPAFMIPEEKRSHGRLWLAIGLLAAAGSAAYFTSGTWMPLFAPTPVNLHLQVLDREGQLRIQWDREALASQNVQGGSLEIADGGSPTTILLTGSRVRLGSLQYARRSETVEVHLTVKTPHGPIEEFTSFYGQPPGAAGVRTPEQQKQAELAAEAERARGDLKKEELRSAELQRSLEEMRQQMRRDQERKRLEDQVPAKVAPAAEPSPSRAAAPVATARTNPSSSTGPAGATPTSNVATQQKPQSSAQTLVPQPTRPLSPPPDKPAAPSPPPAPPPPAQAVNRPAAAPAQPARPAEPSLSGKWVYSRASKSGSAYPPESVTMMLSETYTHLTGTFRGRYKTPKGAKINPRVNFTFEGSLRPGASKFNFTAADGTKGQIELIRLPGKQNALEVVWYSERDKLTFDDIFFRVP